MMVLYGDYHTHTKFSHGSGTIEDNVKAAIGAGLKQIAITDHGLKHIAFGLRKRKIKKMKTQIEALRKIYPVDILLGVEANITALDGQIDMTDEEFALFDIVLVGYHKFVWPKSIYDYLNFFTPNYFYDTFRTKAPDKVMLNNTKAIINCMERFPVDVVTHINYGMRVDCKAIAKACADTGTYLEINGKRITYTQKDMEDMLSTNVQFIINSDAHSPGRVGEVKKGEELINKVNIPKERIVNLAGAPVLRSQAGKIKHSKE